MKILKQLLEILREFEELIHNDDFEQFTIDFVQNEEMYINENVDEGNLTDIQCSDLLGSVNYQIGCILDIMKEGKDKNLFLNLRHRIRNEIGEM